MYGLIPVGIAGVVSSITSYKLVIKMTSLPRRRESRAFC